MLFTKFKYPLALKPYSFFFFFYSLIRFYICGCILNWTAICFACSCELFFLSSIKLFYFVSSLSPHFSYELQLKENKLFNQSWIWSDTFFWLFDLNKDTWALWNNSSITETNQFVFTFCSSSIFALSCSLYYGRYSKPQIFWYFLQFYGSEIDIHCKFVCHLILWWYDHLHLKCCSLILLP